MVAREAHDTRHPWSMDGQRRQAREKTHLIEPNLLVRRSWFCLLPIHYCQASLGIVWFPTGLGAVCFSPFEGGSAERKAEAGGKAATSRDEDFFHILRYTAPRGEFSLSYF